MKKNFFEKKSYYLKCAGTIFKGVCRNFSKIHGSPDIKLLVILRFPKIVLRNKIINKTRTAKTQENSAHCFAENISRIISQPRLQRIFSLQEEGKKEAMEHFKHVINIFPNRGHIFQNKLRHTWTAILKILTNVLLNNLAFSASGKNKNKIKTYEHMSYQYNS